MAKPIKLHAHAYGRNHNGRAESAAFEALNPNGRVLVIEDPSTGIVLFESGAIIEYLVETYDKERKLTYDTLPEKYQLKCGLHFQVSGQGSYYGQSVHFQHAHPNIDNPIKLPTAIERYKNEARRVVGVLDKHLEKHGTGYLVGDKLTYADLAFVPWNISLPTHVLGEGYDPKVEAPSYVAWQENMMEQPSAKRAYERKQVLVDDFVKQGMTI